MTTTYLCGHCPLGQEYRSETEDDVRNHITKTTDSRHRGHAGSDPDVVIYRAGEERDGITLSIGLDEAATSDDQEKRAIAALLEYPYASKRMVQRIADVSERAPDRVLDNYSRVALERERRALDYVREDTRYRQRPDGTPKQPTIDDTERRIINYALDNPDDTAEDVQTALDLEMSVEDIEEVVRTKTVCPKLPSKHDQVRIFRYYNENPDASTEEIADATDTGVHQVEDAFRIYADDGDLYLNLARIDDLKVEDELLQDAHQLGFPILPPDERPTMHVHKDTLLYVYHYRNNTLADAGRVCGVTGPTINGWLERHGIHPNKNDYDFDLSDLYDGHDDENDRDFVHLIPSSRDADEAPDKVVREAGNVRYEGPELDTTSGRAPQTFDERPVQPDTLADEADADEIRDWLDTDAIEEYKYPDALHDPSENVSNLSRASRYAAGAFIQLPSDTPVQQAEFAKAVSDLMDMHPKSIEQRSRALGDAGYVSVSMEDFYNAPKYVSVTDEQLAVLRGEAHPESESEPEPEPVSEPSADEAADEVSVDTPTPDRERPQIHIDEPKPVPAAESVMSPPESVEQTEIIAGQHPDDVFDTDEYLRLIGIVADHSSPVPENDPVFRKLVRLGGVALESANPD